MDNARKRKRRRTRKRFDEISLSISQSSHEPEKIMDNARNGVQRSEKIPVTNPNINAMPVGSQVENGKPATNLENRVNVVPIIETREQVDTCVQDLPINNCYADRRKHSMLNAFGSQESSVSNGSHQQLGMELNTFDIFPDVESDTDPSDTAELSDRRRSYEILETREQYQGETNSQELLRQQNQRNERSIAFVSPLQDWTSILAVILSTGSHRFSRNQLNRIRTIVMCMKYESNLRLRLDSRGRLMFTDRNGKVVHNAIPSYSTVQRVLRPSIDTNLGTRSYDIAYNRSTRERRRFQADDEIAIDETRIRIIPVSEHARADISFPSFISASKETNGLNYSSDNYDHLRHLQAIDASTPGLKHWDCMDDCPLIANREELYSDHHVIHAKRSQEFMKQWMYPHRAYVGEKISFVIRSNAALSNRISQQFCTSSDGSQNVLLGKIIGIGIATVIDTHSNIIISSSSYGKMAKYIIDALRMKLRESQSHKLLSDVRTANRRQQFFGAGDILAVLAANGEAESNFYIVLVNRFNVPSGEYDEQLFCVTGSLMRDGTFCVQLNEPLDAFGNIIVDVHDVNVVESCSNNLLRLNGHHVRNSSGTLKDGRRYFIYRFIIFWDGFAIGSTSMQGVYCISLNLPSKYRSTSRAVRVLSLLPKNVPSSVVLEELLADIKIGMTTGYEDYDAEGHKVTIFLDMVGCIGDTPALNDVIDVRGHNAIACCHLCRFRRVTDENGIKIGSDMQLHKPRYMGTEVHGGKAFASRSSHKHDALHAHPLDDETLQRLGIKGAQDFPFSKIPAEFEKIAERVPLTENSIPVVPTTFDSYRALLIGPDHLLFGLSKDCINSVLRMLPNDSYILAFEKIAICSLQEARLRTQGRLVNMRTKQLFSMTISEVFALLLVSEYSIHRTVMEIDGVPLSSDTTAISKKCNQTIQLLGSLSSVAARIWFRPRVEEDGIHMVREFNKSNGLPYLEATQNMIEEHITQMRDVASYDEEDAREYKSCTGRGRRIKERKEHLECILRETFHIVRILDKPNVHRLLELAYVYLPMLGSATRLSELEFEKGHQTMKRAIERSNQHDSHLQAVSSAVYNDWQGRMSMLLNDMEDDKETTKRAFLKLIMGRDFITAREGILTKEDEAIVRKAVGPNLLIQKLFELLDEKVMNNIVPLSGNSFWHGVLDEKTLSYSISINGKNPFQYFYNAGISVMESLQKRVKALLTRAESLLDISFGAGKWKLLERVSPGHHSHGNANKELEIHSGDVIQCIALPPSSISFEVHPYHEEMGFKECEQIELFVLFLFQCNLGCGAIALPCAELQQNIEEKDNNTEIYSRISLPGAVPKFVKKDLDDVRMLVLSRSCQRVLVQHRCGPDCNKQTNAQFTDRRLHNEHPLISQFYTRNRAAGYPPRSA